MAPRRALSVGALFLLSCSPAEPCGLSPDASLSATGEIVLGERDAEGRFVAFSNDGEADLVFGTQGGWMVLVEPRLPVELLAEPCVQVRLQASVDDRPVAPLSVRTRPALDGSLEPIPVLLSFDIGEVDGGILSLEATARSETWMADGVASSVRIRRAP